MDSSAGCGDGAAPPATYVTLSVATDPANANGRRSNKTTTDDGEDEDTEYVSHALCSAGAAFRRCLRRSLGVATRGVDTNHVALFALVVAFVLIIIRAQHLAVIDERPVACVCQMDPDLELRHGPCPLTSLIGRGERPKAGQDWRPLFCHLYVHTSSSIASCHRRRSPSRVAFLGDRNLRTLYQAYVARLGGAVASQECSEDTPSFCEYIDADLGLEVNFIPCDADMITEMHVIYNAGEPEEYVINSDRPRRRPDMIVAGAASWWWSTPRRGNGSITDAEVGLAEYDEFLEGLSVPMGRLTANGTLVLWTLQEAVVESLLSPELAAVLSNDLVDQYNELAVRRFKANGVAAIWRSFREMGDDGDNGTRHDPATPIYNGYRRDYRSAVRRQQVALLNNVFCNEYQSDADCSDCKTTYPLVFPLVTMQQWTLGVLSLLMLVTFMQFGRCTPPFPLGRVAVVVLFAFLCDKTQFFEKGMKPFTVDNNPPFWLPLVVVLLVGAVFGKHAPPTPDALQSALVDEWRGWLQVVLIVCQLTASDEDGGYLAPYVMSRVAVTCHVFLAGHEAFMHLYRGGEASWQHYLGVLFDLNFAVVLMKFALGQPYYFYAVVPWVTFWYTFYYLVLSMPPVVVAEGNTSIGQCAVWSRVALAVKLCASATLIAVFHSITSAGWVDKFFMSPMWGDMFVVDAELLERRERYNVDRYAALVGVLASAVYATMAQLRGGFGKNLTECKPTWRSRLVAAVFGVAGVALYACLAAATCDTRSRCDSVHAHVGVLAALGYAALRWAVVRGSAHSSWFAWLGGIWVELSVLQCHVWAVQDGKGMVKLLPFNPAVNVVVAGLVLLCAANELKRGKDVLRKFAVPEATRWAPLKLIPLLLVVVCMIMY